MSLKYDYELYITLMNYTQRWWTLHNADGCCEVLIFNFCILINKYPVVLGCVTPGLVPASPSLATAWSGLLQAALFGLACLLCGVGCCVAWPGWSFTWAWTLLCLALHTWNLSEPGSCSICLLSGPCFG